MRNSRACTSMNEWTFWFRHETLVYVRCLSWFLMSLPRSRRFFRRAGLPCFYPQTQGSSCLVKSGDASFFSTGTWHRAERGGASEKRNVPSTHQTTHTPLKFDQHFCHWGRHIPYIWSGPQTVLGPVRVNRLTCIQNESWIHDLVNTRKRKYQYLKSNNCKSRVQKGPFHHTASQPFIYLPHTHAFFLNLSKGQNK